MEREFTAFWMVLYVPPLPTVMHPEGAEVRLAARTEVRSAVRAKTIFMLSAVCEAGNAVSAVEESRVPC